MGCVSSKKSNKMSPQHSMTTMETQNGVPKNTNNPSKRHKISMTYTTSSHVTLLTRINELNEHQNETVELAKEDTHSEENDVFL